MSKYSIKKLVFTLSCLIICSVSLADTTQPASSGATNAIAFGVQAGQIAGAAQACGIDISTFTTRVSEAINKLALNPTDKSAATDSFQKSLGQAQAMQAANHPIACSQVTQDFSNLPLLRADYEQSVISQLNPGMTDNNASNNSANSSTQTNATTNQSQPTNNTTNQNQSANNANTQSSGTSGNNTNATNNNPAYGSSNTDQYGAYTPTRNNYDNAINSLNTTNQQSLNQSSGSSSQSSTTTNTQQNSSNTSTNSTNPPPPSFTNPNNTAPTTSGY